MLRALGRDTELAQSSLRFSLGRFSREEEVELAMAAVAREVQPAACGRARARRMSPVAAPPSGNEGCLDALPPTVRALFGGLQHAGALAGAEVRRGEAGRERHGTRVRFSLRIARASACIEVRYRAYGCPTRSRPANGWRASSKPGGAGQC